MCQTLESLGILIYGVLLYQILTINLGEAENFELLPSIDAKLTAEILKLIKTSNSG